MISVGAFGHCGDNEVWAEGTKAMLDRMHLAKIDLADEIFVINMVIILVMVLVMKSSMLKRREKE